MGLTLAGSVALIVWLVAVHGLSIPDGMGPFDLGQLSDPAQGATVNWATLVSLGIGDIVAIDFMQRIFSARSPEVARRACFIGAAGTVIIGVPFALVALGGGGLLPSGGEGPVLFQLLDGVAPMWLAVLVLSGIVAASLSTADGAILGTAAVAVRNVGGVRRVHAEGKADPLLRATRIAMIPVVLLAVVLALRVPQTGILLTLAFDLLLACLLVPFVLGMFWRRSTAAGAMASLLVGLVVRLGLFALTPTIYGVDNTILYVRNDLVGAGFDGWPTFVAFGASLVTFVAVSLATGRGSAGQRGADIVVREETVRVDREVEPAGAVS